MAAHQLQKLHQRFRVLYPGIVQSQEAAEGAFVKNR